MGPTKQVTIRLGTDGKAGVVRDYKEIGDASKAAYGAAEAGAEAVARASDRASAAADRQAERLLLQAQKARQAAQAFQSQTDINLILGVDPRSGRGAARGSASVFEEQMRAVEELDARARALKATLDPVAAAQDRLNRELAEYSVLAKAGKLDTEQLAAAQAMARRRFDETSAAMQRQGRLTPMERMSRLNLARQGADVFTTAAMGMNPGLIAIQQGPQILDALATSGIRAGGAMAGVATSVGVVAVAVGGLALAYEQHAASVHKLETAALGVGRSAGLSTHQLLTMAEAGAEAGGLSEASGRKMAEAYLRTGKIGGEVMQDLIAATRDYARTMGVDADQATKELAAAFADPAKGAETLNAKLSFLDDRTLRYIQTLARQNDVTEAQRRLLDELVPSLVKAETQTTALGAAWDWAGRAMSNYWTNLGDFLAGPSLEEAMQSHRDFAAALPGFLGNAYTDYLDNSPLQRRIDEANAKIARDKEAADRNQRSVAAGNIIDSALAADRRVADLQKNRSDLLEAKKLGLLPDRDVAEIDRAVAAIDKEIEAVRKSGDQRDRRAESLARDAASMRINAVGALDLADAYLSSGEAAVQAEARRKALTDATRKGADAEARVRDQLSLAIAEQAAQGAKSAADLGAQAAAQQAVNDAVTAGELAVADMTRALQQEQALRPVLTAQALAEGRAKGLLSKVIAELKANMDALNAAQAEAALLQSIDGQKDALALLERELQLVGATNAERAVSIAQLRAQQDLKRRGAEGAEGAGAFVEGEAEIARRQAALERARYLDDALRSQREQGELLALEIDLLGASSAERALQIEQLRLKQDLLRRGIELTSAEGQAILANHAKLEEVNRLLERRKQGMEDLKAVGEDAIDTFGELLTDSEADWDDWGDAALRVVREIADEMTRLALINPLKNKIFKSDLPTWGDVFGEKPTSPVIVDSFPGMGGSAGEAGAAAVASAMTTAGTTAATALTTAGSTAAGALNTASSTGAGALTTAGRTMAGAIVTAGERAAAAIMAAGDGSSGEAEAAKAALSFIPGNAAGTDHWKGGWTWVGEEGPELMRLPRGAQILSNSRSADLVAQAGARTLARARAMAAGDGGAAPKVEVHNHLGVEARTKVERDEAGGLRVSLYPALQKAVKGMGQDGSLYGSLRHTPGKKKRG